MCPIFMFVLSFVFVYALSMRVCFSCRDVYTIFHWDFGVSSGLPSQAVRSDLASFSPRLLVDLCMSFNVLLKSPSRMTLSFRVVCDRICFLNVRKKFCLNSCFSFNIPEGA